jgi:autotransporter-associated beta strand protein
MTMVRRTATILLASIAMAETASAQTFNIGANFRGATGGSAGTDSPGIVPPDTMGAVGQNHFTVLVNGRYKTFNKTGTQLQSMTDTAFFGSAGYAGEASQPIFGDPRIVFDPLSGRWFAMNFTDASTNNRLVLAVSENADPTGTWKSVTIQTSGGNFADYPTLGIDANGVYIGTNNFGNGSQQSLFTLTKPSLLWTGTGSPNLSGLTSHQNISASNFGFTLQATNNFSVTQTGTSAQVIAVDFNSFGVYNAFKINNTTGTTTLGTPANITASSSWGFPVLATQPGGGTVDALDDRIQSSAVQVGNLLYFVHGITPSGSSTAQIRWGVFNVTSNTLVQQGVIGTAARHFYDPSIAVNELGEAVIGFSSSSSSEFISSWAVVSTNSGSLSFGAPTLISAGNRTYTGIDGSPFRWGDYSMTSLDPADTGIFWTIQERASNTADPGTTNSTWVTQVTEIIPNRAGQVRWQAAASGNYSSASSWFNGAVPTATDHVIYSRNGAPFTVTLPAGTTVNDRISVRQGTTTFNIASGSTYQATNINAATPSFAVSQHLGDTNLTILGGGTLSTVYTTLAAGENGLTTNNISRAVVNLSGSGTTWTNSRDMHFGGSATRSGGTATLNLGSGTVVTVGEVARFWTSTSSVNLTGPTANLNVGGLRADSGVNPNINGAGANVNLNINDGLGQNYFGRISGTMNVVKNGAGTQTLSGTMNYSGLTNVNNGRLNINGVKSGLGAVNVFGGTLGGTGSVAGLVTVLSNGNIAPGSSAGNLTLTGGLTMNAGDYEWELAALTEAGPGANFDVLTLDGGASTIGGTAEVELNFLGAGLDPSAGDPFWNTTRQWLIVDLVGGTLTGNFSGIANPNYSSGFFFLSGGNGDIFLNFAPVPEPTTMVLVGFALAGFVVVRRKRKQYVA